MQDDIGQLIGEAATDARAVKEALDDAASAFKRRYGFWYGQ